MSCLNPICRNKGRGEQMQREQMRLEQMRREEAIRERTLQEEIRMKQRAIIDKALQHPVTRERILKRVRIYIEFHHNIHVPIPQIHTAIRRISYKPYMAPPLPTPLQLNRHQRRQIRGIFNHYDIELDGKIYWLPPVELRSRSLPWGFATAVVQPVLLRATRPVHKEAWRRVVTLAGRVIAMEGITAAQMTRVAVASQDRHSDKNKSWGDEESWVTECLVYLGKPFD